MQKSEDGGQHNGQQQQQQEDHGSFTADSQGEPTPQDLNGQIDPQRLSAHAQLEQLDNAFVLPPIEISGRRPSAASGDTYQQAQFAFEDFDGVHYAPSIRESIREGAQENPRAISNGSQNTRLSGVRVPSMMLSPTDDQLRLPPPPPSDNMIYYPAPVPRTLNLPKRLSQVPNASVQAKRRTQVLDSLEPGARKSAAWLTAPDQAMLSGDPSGARPKSMIDPRRSIMNVAGLPPQLRASIFFDHQPVTHDVEIREESAVATLESILDAGANAPVSAFTDHPIAGRVGSEIYGKDAPRKSTSSLNDDAKADKRKTRASMGVLFNRRASSNTNLLSDPDAATKSQKTPPIQFTPDSDDEEHDANARAPQERAANELEPESEDEDQQPGPEVDPIVPYGAPTTLLAELQMRKQQLRSRNRTAATGFPNGMHSTLLELDAVAEVEMKHRKGQRVALAWEDPGIAAAQAAADEDDDVPLGLLFSPGNNGALQKNGPTALGLNDVERPMGLIEKREMEENEPLSKRRTRLLGVDPRLAKKASQPEFSPRKLDNDTPPTEGEQEEEETLAQRLRRLKSKQQLDQVVDEVAQQRPVSKEFETEMLSQLGIKVDSPTKEEHTEEKEANLPIRNPTPKITIPEDEHELEEETLGQRRARLQAVAALNSSAPGVRNLSNGSLQPGPTMPLSPPLLKQRRSLADLLAAHPLHVGANASKRITDDVLVSSMPENSLLAQNEARTAKHRSYIHDQNKRSSSFGFDKPLINVPAPNDTYGGIKRSGGFAGGALNDGMGGHSHDLPPTPMTMGNMSGYYGNMNPYGGYPPQQMGMGMPMNNNLNMTMGLNMGYGMPMAGGYGMMMDAPMDPRQRDVIDQWRQSIVP